MEGQMNGDWPAAHSMDTEWYAIDKCGHVGKFFTGEAGALPKTGDDKGCDKLLGGSLCLEDASRFSLGQLAALAVGALGKPLPSHAMSDEVKERLVLLFLRPDEAARITLFAGKLMGKDVFSKRVEYKKEPVYATVGEFTPEMFDEIHANGWCRSCILDDESMDMACFMGAYTFSPVGSNDAVWPYEPSHTPDVPRTWEEMGLETPPIVVFKDFCFEDKSEIQVTKYVPCALYSEEYEALIIPEDATDEEKTKILEGK